MLHDLLNWIEVGSWVVEHEKVTGLRGRDLEGIAVMCSGPADPRTPRGARATRASLDRDRLAGTDEPRHLPGLVGKVSCG